MEGWEIIQQCELAPHTGLYGKRLFISAINDLTPDQFNKFCREYLHLMEFYSRSRGAWVTDYTPLMEANPALFWQLTPINFDAPVTFTLVK
jgi:hypothetical protein